MKHTLTRDEVIHAIRTEPLLVAGYWVNPNGYAANLEAAIDRGCSFCAVGAVLRSVVDKNMSIERFGHEAYRVARFVDLVLGEFDKREDAPHQALRKGNYMGALNFFFEQASEVDPLHARDDTCTFVRDYFPETITFEVP